MTNLQFAELRYGVSLNVDKESATLSNIFFREEMRKQLCYPIRDSAVGELLQLVKKQLADSIRLN